MPGLACRSFVSARTTVLGTLRAPMRDKASAESFCSSSLPAFGLPSARFSSRVCQKESAVPDTCSSSNAFLRFLACHNYSAVAFQSAATGMRLRSLQLSQCPPGQMNKHPRRAQFVYGLRGWLPCQYFARRVRVHGSLYPSMFRGHIPRVAV